MEWPTWVPGRLSIGDIEKLQPAGNNYGDHVEEAASIGIGELDRLFNLDHLPSDAINNWVATTQEYEEADQALGGKLARLEQAWRLGPSPPPIIAVRFADGKAWGLDGWHRMNAAIRADLAAIPCWLAQEDRR